MTLCNCLLHLKEIEDGHPEMGQARGAQDALRKSQVTLQEGKATPQRTGTKSGGLGVVKPVQQMMGQGRRLRTKTTNQLRGRKSAFR